MLQQIVKKQKFNSFTFYSTIVVVIGRANKIYLLRCTFMPLAVTHSKTDQIAMFSKFMVTS